MGDFLQHLVAGKEMISIIIGIMGNDEERLKNFDAMLDCFDAQDITSGYDITVVEQLFCDSDPVFHRDRVTERGHRYMIIQGQPFSLSWCFNVGAKQAEGDILMFMGAGLVFGKDFVRRMDSAYNGKYALGWDELMF